MLRVLLGFEKQVENPSKAIKHKGPLLVQMPCPNDQIFNHSLNMGNRVINSAFCKSASEILENFRDKGALFLHETHTAKQPPDA